MLVVGAVIGQQTICAGLQRPLFDAGLSSPAAGTGAQLVDELENPVRR
jgi:hypothetical protein